MMYNSIRFEEQSIIFYITEACNSNCIMCPMSADSRKRGTQGITYEEWNSFLQDINNNVFDISRIEHICITGGEPLLKWQLVIDILHFVYQYLPTVPILILTNGRAFSLDSVQKAFANLLTPMCRVAVPLHSTDSAIHDQICKTKGAFQETIIGLHFLASTSAEIEIRVVGSMLNAYNISSTLKELSGMGLRITCLNLIAMEMHGCPVQREQ